MGCWYSKDLLISKNELVEFISSIIFSKKRPGHIQWAVGTGRIC